MERDLADALRRLKAAAAVPPVDPAREAALLAAFDAERPVHSTGRRDYWCLGAFAAAAVLFLALALPAGTSAPHTPSSSRDVQSAAAGDFTIVPGAAGLPPMESGTLVRMDVPVSMLPSLGVTPPPGQAKAVTADLIVAQDGLPRAVRLVSP
jgi:hypothetical protein